MPAGRFAAIAAAVRVVRDDLGVDVRLADPPRDQLGVLCAKVDDEDRARLGHPVHRSSRDVACQRTSACRVRPRDDADCSDGARSHLPVHRLWVVKPDRLPLLRELRHGARQTMPLLRRVDATGVTLLRLLWGEPRSGRVGGARRRGTEGRHRAIRRSRRLDGARHTPGPGGPPPGPVLLFRCDGRRHHHARGRGGEVHRRRRGRRLRRARDARGRPRSGRTIGPVDASRRWRM